jgi:uncharacterized membrane protein (UPF0127 family)
MFVLKNYEIADGPLKKALGIMFRKRISKPLLFPFSYEHRISIHSFFCPRFDAVFLDGDRKVIDLHGKIAPGRVLTSSKPAKYLIEFPAGTIKSKKLKKRELVRIQGKR